MQSHLVITNQINLTPNDISPIDLTISHPDLYLATTDTAQIGIDVVRDIISFLAIPPYKTKVKTVYIPQANRLTNAAQNALLKTLEEPPTFAYIILTATEITQLLPTIVSRCQIHYRHLSLKPNHNPEIAKLLNQTCSANLGQRIQLASKYSAKKDNAITITTDIIYYLHYQIKSNPNPAIVNNLKVAHQTLIFLQANTNPQLSLENMFFNFQTLG